MDTVTLIRIFAGCAAQEISRHFAPNSCIASTAITIDVMAHYGLKAYPWEVCLLVERHPDSITVGCHPPETSDSIGGHLVALVDGNLIDSSFGQIEAAHPTLKVPPVFVGKLLPLGAPLAEQYHFSTPFAEVYYRYRPITGDYRSSRDWDCSPEREVATMNIIRRIEGFRVNASG